MDAGSLTAHMVGNQRVRVSKGGAEITGLLTALRIGTITGSSTGFTAPGVQRDIWISVTIGKTHVNDMRINHPVALLESET